MKKDYITKIQNKEFIEMIEKYNIDLDNYEVQKFDEYPKGIKFVDNKNKKEIVIYDDFLLNKIQIIYVNLHIDIESLKQEIELLKQEFLSMKEEETEQLILKVRIDSSYIQYIGDGNENKFESPYLNEGNLYEMYDYFYKEIQKMLKS